MAEKLKDFEYYMNLNYPIKYWNDDDGFFVEIPDLPGCMTFCEEFNQINEMVEDAKKSWISSRLERGLEVPEPRNEEDFSGKILLRLTKSLHRNLSNQAKREGISLNQYMLSLLSSSSSLREIENRLIEAIKELQLQHAGSTVLIRDFTGIQSVSTKQPSVGGDISDDVPEFGIISERGSLSRGKKQKEWYQ